MISERKAQHAKFIASDEWATIRCDLFMLRGEQCELCGRKKSLHIHHITYERFGGDEEPDDLIILCATCHMKEHGIIKPARKKRKSSKQKKTKKYHRPRDLAKKIEFQERKKSLSKLPLVTSDSLAEMKKEFYQSHDIEKLPEVRKIRPKRL